MRDGNITLKNESKLEYAKKNWMAIVIAVCFLFSFLLFLSNLISDKQFWKSGWLQIISYLVVAIISMGECVSWIQRFLNGDESSRISQTVAPTKVKREIIDDEEDYLSGPQIIFKVFGAIALFVGILSVFMPRNFRNIAMFLIPVIWALFYANIAETYDDEEDIPQLVFWFCGAAFFINWTTGYQVTILSRCSIAFFFFIAGFVTIALKKSNIKNEDIRSILKSLAVIFVLAIGINSGINYTFAFAETIKTTITDKYVLEATSARDSDDYCFDVTNVPEGIIEEKLRVYEDTYNDYEIGDTYNVNARKSIFNVLTIEDPVSAENDRNNSIIRLEGKIKIYAVAAICVALICFIAAALFNLQLLLVCISGTLGCGYMTYKSISDGDGALWVILGIALTLLFVVGLVWSIIELVIYGEIIDE